MAKGQRGFKFTITKIESLLDVINDIVPIGNSEWEQVWNRHNHHYPSKEWTVESLRCKFLEMARKKVPTGDPNCPPHIRSSKCIYRKIIQATDGSDGESDLNSLEINAGDHDDEQEEEEEDVDNEEQIEFAGGGHWVMILQVASMTRFGQRVRWSQWRTQLCQGQAQLWQ